MTLRLKAPHTLILGPSVFEVPNICSADIRGIPFRFRLADVDGNTVMTGLSAQYRVVPMLICIYWIHGPQTITCNQTTHPDPSYINPWTIGYQRDD